MTTTEHRNGTLARALKQHIVQPMEALSPGQESTVGVYAIKTKTGDHFWVRITRILQCKENSGQLHSLEFEGRANGRSCCVYAWSDTGQLGQTQDGSVQIEGLDLI